MNCKKLISLVTALSVAISAFTILPSLAEAEDDALVKNGSFEDTDLITTLDWKFSKSGTWYSGGTREEQSGNHYISVNGSGLGQRVTLEADKIYKLTARVKSTGSTAYFGFNNGNTDYPGSNIIENETISGEEWHDFAVYYDTSDGAVTNVLVYLWSDSGVTTCIDDVALEEVTDYITELSGYFDDDGNLNYEADYITESENAVLYVAMYDKDGALVSCGRGKSGELKGAGDYGEYTLKAFLWEDMKPLADTKTETVRYTEDGMSAYMFVHFTGAEKAANQEQIYFSVSTDGKEWEILNGGENILTSTVGEKGVRDPYIVRSPKNGKYYIIATDLSIYNRGNNTTAWEQCQNAKSDNPNPGSKNIVVWESDDLVNWSSPRLAQFAPDDAGCCWAPECIWDEEKQSFLVFGASRTSEDDYTYLRLYGSYTTDFETFTEPQLLMDASKSYCHVFDTTITKAGDKYYRIYKTDRIQIDTASSLSGEWSALNTNIAEIATNHEGPTICKVNGEDKWNLMLDKLSPNGYIPFITDNLAEGQFTADTDVSFPAGVQYRHGAIMPITGGEYKALIQKYRK